MTRSPVAPVTLPVADREVEPGFRYCRFRPTGPSELIVEHYWGIQATRCRTAVERALPDSTVEIYFNLGSGGRQVFSPSDHSLSPRAAWVVGPRVDSLLILKETSGCDLVGVRLHSGVAAQLLGVPTGEIVSSLVDLDQFWGAEAGEIRTRLADAADIPARVLILQRLLAGKLRSGVDYERLRRVRSLSSEVARNQFGSVSQAAKTLGLSHRGLIALFDQYLGLKPKAYHRVDRLRQVMKTVRRSTPPSWAQVAIQTGYSDQSHLIHDFRRLTGLTPVTYRANKTRVGDGFVPFRLAPAEHVAGGEARTYNPG
jgi:AraC-like DNA-binding protein